MEKYRITTDGDTFRVESFQEWEEIAGWFWWGKKIKKSYWCPCDNIGQPATDDDGMVDVFEIVEYDTLKEAQTAVADFQTEPKTPIWKQVWP